MGDWPLHEKLQEHLEETYTLSAFLDWLGERGIHLMSEQTLLDQKPCWNYWSGKPSGDGCDDSCDLCHGDGYLEEEVTRMFPIPQNFEQLIGAFLDIDPEGLSAEKQAMYEALVAANNVG